MLSRISTALLLTAALAAPGHADTTIVGFDKGNAQGWIGPVGPGGSTSILSSGGNPTWNMRTVFNNFGIGFFNNSNKAFIGDYTAAQSVTIKIDLRVEFLGFFGQNVSRPWLVELRNSSLASGGYPWVSVWYKFAQVSAATHGQWTTFSVTFDPSSTTLPSGWKGYGAEDPVTFEPILPPGVTFDEVLAGIDAVSFTTLEPGLFFGFTDHTFRIDNITVTRVPASVFGDLNGDGSVGAPDLSILLSAWGACAPGQPCAADLNGDGTVGPQDLAALLASWN